MRCGSGSVGLLVSEDTVGYRTLINVHGGGGRPSMNRSLKTYTMECALRQEKDVTLFKENYFVHIS